MTPFRLFCAGIAMLASFTVQAQSKHYVKPAFAGTHTGKTWATAFDNLQTAIDSAKAGDSIFVRWGSYFPLKIAGGVPTSVRSRAFVLKNEVKIYGGFAGIETTLAERDTSGLLTKDVSNLIGELGGTDSADNIYHIILALGLNSKTVLNGFNIFSACANGIGNDTVNGMIIKRNVGGGIYADSSSMEIAHVRLSHNSASLGGGGIYTTKSTLKMRNSDIIYNYVNGSDLTQGGGAGIYNVNSTPSFDSLKITYNQTVFRQGGAGVRNEKSNAVFTNSSFAYNYAMYGNGGGAIYNMKSNAMFSNIIMRGDSASGEGGGMYNDSSAVFLTNVLFDSTWAHGFGGGMNNMAKSDAVLDNVVFRKNFTDSGGAGMRNWKSSPRLNNVRFIQNIAKKDGGAVSNYFDCNPTFTNCTFTENRSENGNGGGLCNKRNSHAVITNSLFTYNFAWVYGGGIANMADSTTGSQPASIILTNVTIANNNAYYSGGGGYDDGFGASELRNSIVQGNHGFLYEDIDAPPSLVSTALFSSIVADEFYFTGTSIPLILSKPVFLDTFARDFRLAAGSPALDMGDSSFYATTGTPNLSSIKADIRGARRIMGDNVDLGAYEVCDDSTLAVSIAVMPGTDIASGASVTFTASAKAAGLTPVFTWRKNGIVIAGVTGPTFTGVAGTDFITGDIITAALKSASVCASSDTANSNILKMKVFPVGIHSYSTNQSEITLFPNPNQGNFTIKGDFTAGADYQLMVNDVTGRTVYQENFVAAAGSNSKEIMLNNKLNAGVYFLSVKMDNQNKQIIRFVLK